MVKVNTHQIKDKKTYFASWWGSDKRPAKYVMIGSSDGYIVLLNTEAEEILAYPRTKSYNNAEVIAYDFEKFVRATATVYISVQNEVIDNSLVEIPSIICSNIDNDFWRELIRI